MIAFKLITVIIFFVTYILVVAFYSRKMLFVWAASAVYLALGILSPGEALAAIDWNVVLLYFGMLFVSEAFLYSRMPDFIAVRLASRTNRVALGMVLLCALSGVLSVALENVAVVLLMAPIAFSIAQKCEINPAPLFTGIAVSSNLQGAATLIGDPPSMLLASFTQMSFNDFFFLKGTPSIFFAVQIGALFSLAVLYLFFRRQDKPMPVLRREPVLSLVPTLLVLLLIGSLVCSSLLAHEIDLMTGMLCCFFGLLSLCWHVLQTRGRNFGAFLKRLDWQTGAFLIGIFVLVGGLSRSGLMEDAAGILARISNQSSFLLFMLVVWLSVLLSAIVDNIPFLVTMLPVVRMLSDQMAINPELLYFGLLIGASVGGNITPVGASANIVATGLLKRQGHAVSFWEFMKMGLPFALVSVLASSIFIWLAFR